MSFASRHHFFISGSWSPDEETKKQFYESKREGLVWFEQLKQLRGETSSRRDCLSTQSCDTASELTQSPTTPTSRYAFLCPRVDIQKPLVRTTGINRKLFGWGSADSLWLKPVNNISALPTADVSMNENVCREVWKQRYAECLRQRAAVTSSAVNERINPLTWGGWCLRSLNWIDS